MSGEPLFGSEALVSDFCSDEAEGKLNLDFSSPLEPAAALNTKPPFTGSLVVEELVALLASGLKLLPANVNAAGGAGGATFFSSAASFGLLAAAANEKVEVAGLGVDVFGTSAAVNDGAFPEAKPAKGDDAAAAGGAGLFSFGLSAWLVPLVPEEAAGEAAPKEKPEKGFGALDIVSEVVAGFDCGALKLKAGDAFGALDVPFELTSAVLPAALPAVRFSSIFFLSCL